MRLTIPADLETKIRARAREEGISVEAYLERLLRAEEQAKDEIEALAVGGIASGEPIEVGPGYWEEKHRQLDERLKKMGRK